MNKIVFTVLILTLPISSILAGPQNKPADAAPVFSEAAYRAHLNFLADDLCEGRAPGTRGGDLAAFYIATQYQAAGLQPISPEQGYYQQVPMIGNTTDHETLSFRISAGNSTLDLKPVDEVVVGSELAAQQMEVADELWFVGYGIEAPEYNWNDYKGMDVSGKIIVMLVNDPDFEKTGFGSESLTYYGRWTYKLEIARIKGAKGILMIHTEESATYGFEVVQASWTIERVSIEGEIRNPTPLQGWMAQPAFDRALAHVDLDYARLKVKADDRSFKPMPLNLSVSTTFKQKCRTFNSPNVIGILPGTDLKDEAVIYMGHYDHLGVGRSINGDNIYNGAVDNASGIAALICLARAFTQAPQPPRRSILFMATTGEETGLLGSEYYTVHPVFPLEKTVVALNKDCCNFYGRRDGFSVFPAQYSDAEADLHRLGDEMGLKLRVGGVDRGGGAFRVDNFPFCARGVVGLSVGIRGDNTSITPEEEKELRQKTGRWYHQPNDELYPHFRYDGVLQEMDILYHVGRYYGDGAKSPTLKGDNPFKPAIRIRETKYVSEK